MEIVVRPDRLDDAGLEGLVVSSVTFCSLTTPSTSVRYLPLKAIFASCPSTAASISPISSPSSSDLEEMTILPGASSPPGVMIRRTIPLPSRAKMEAILQALEEIRHGDGGASRESLRNRLGIFGESSLHQLRNKLGFLHVEHDLALIGVDCDIHGFFIVGDEPVEFIQSARGDNDFGLFFDVGGQRHPVNCQAETVGGGQRDRVTFELRMRASEYRTGFLGGGGKNNLVDGLYPRWPCRLWF